MKFLFKLVSLSLFVLFLPIAVYSLVSNLIKDSAPTLVSGYDFVALADIPFIETVGEGEGEGACESAGTGAGCEGEGGGK